MVPRPWLVLLKWGSTIIWEKKFWPYKINLKQVQLGLYKYVFHDLLMASKNPFLAFLAQLL